MTNVGGRAGARRVAGELASAIDGRDEGVEMQMAQRATRVEGTVASVTVQES